MTSKEVTDMPTHREVEEAKLEAERLAEEVNLEAMRLEYDPYAGHPDPDDW